MENAQYEKITGLLNDVLYQLHVISSQNFNALAHSEDEELRKYGENGLGAEAYWMKNFVKGDIYE